MFSKRDAHAIASGYGQIHNGSADNGLSISVPEKRLAQALREHEIHQNSNGGSCKVPSYEGLDGVN